MGVSGMLVGTVMVGGEKFCMFKSEFENWKGILEFKIRCASWGNFKTFVVEL